MKTSFVLLIILLGTASHSQFANAQSAGTFTAVSNMTTPRSVHTATLLLDGRVLIAGGENASSPLLSSTEIYDPATQTFTPSGNMTVARSGHTATLLADGRVLIVGGDSIGSAEIYDPSTGSFTATGSLLMARHANATLLSTGKVLITGGSVGPTATSSPPCPPCSITWLIGDAELYDPSTGVFTPAGAYAGVLANNTVAADGFGSTSTLLPDGTVLFGTEPAAQIYDPSSSSFALRGTITITTGWGATLAPPYISGQSANLLLNGKVLLAGGEQEDEGRFNSARLYDVASGVFTPAGSMMRARDNHTATLLPDGTVLMAGGESQASGPWGYWFSGTESSAEVYDPVADAFSTAANMTAARELHTATLLNSGDVLITGGIAYPNPLGPNPLGPPAGMGAGIPVLASAELYHPATAVPAPVLFSLLGDGSGQGAIWHATTGEIASPENPAMTGEALSTYTTNLAAAGVIPPQVVVGGRLADVIYFGPAPGYAGYYQVNFQVPDGIAMGPSVSVRLTYLGRSSNPVTIGVQ